MMVTWVLGLFEDESGPASPPATPICSSADFVDVENHPTISFSGPFTERTASTALKGEVDLGEWQTPF